jgi:hypothetical protein
MPETNERWLWYERTGFVIAALVIFWPIGAALMWSQKKFTQQARTWITAIAAVATLLLVLAILPPPSGMVGEPTSKGEASQTPAPSVFSTGTATSTVATTGTVSVPSTGAPTTPPSTPAPPANPGNVTPPSNYNPPAGPAQARFTMVGTYTTNESGQVIDFTLTATPASGIVSWEWWVTASGSTSSYSGSTVHDSYTGLAPTSVKLIAYDSSGKSYTSQAGVDVNNGKLYAAVK